MTLGTVLLRLSLCLALVFNGMATAAGSVRMAQMRTPMDHVSGHALQSVAKASHARDAMPCDQHQTLSAQPADSEQVGTGPGSTASVSVHPAPDCCKSGTCRCACLQQSASTLPTMALHVMLVAQTDSVRPMVLGHTAPALPHLTRPPIG